MLDKRIIPSWQYCFKFAPKPYKLNGNIEALLLEKVKKLEDKKFRSVSIRDPLVKQIEDFIAEHPKFIEENPEYNSVAGFLDKAGRKLLLEFKKEA